jgi:ribosome-binding factor A
MSRRPEQVANLIREELSKIISKEIEFPDLLVTITDVKVDSKLNQAIVSFSVLAMCGGCPMAGACHEIEQAKYFESASKILEKNRKHLQYLLMKKINIKPMPQIIFKIDYGLEKAAEIEKLLLDDKIKGK